MYSYEEENDTKIHIQTIKMRQEKLDGFIAMSGKANYSSDETEGEEEGPFGYFSLVIYDTDWTKDIQEAADEYSGHNFDAYSQLGFSGKDYKDTIDYYGRINVHGRIALLDNFTVYEEYRNRGLGNLFMKELIWYLHTIFHVNYILLHAHPYQIDLPYPKEETKDLTSEMKVANNEYIKTKKNELSEFYQKFGYKHTGASHLNYMVLSVDNYVSNKKDHWRKENIESTLFSTIATLPLRPKERKPLLELFQFYRDVDGEEVLDGCDEETFMKKLLSFHFTDKMLQLFNEWGGNKRKTLQLEVTPYFLYFFNLYLDMYSDMHDGDYECEVYMEGKCNMCSLLEKYTEMISFEETYSVWLEESDELMETYKELLPKEKIDKLYFELKDQLEKERLVRI